MSEDSYNSDQIQVISGIEGVRKRPGMYLGSTDEYGIEKFVYELVSNALDCYLSGTATFVSVEIDGSKITVVDDGLGLPFDLPSETAGISLATQCLTTLHVTGTTDGHAPHVHVRYPDGVGLAVLNAVSSQLKVQSWRDGVLWQQQFHQGIPLGEPTIVEQGAGRGTIVEITPDSEIFKQAKPRLNVIRWNLFETAHLVKGIEIRFQQERFYAPEGLVQLLPFINIDRSHPYNYPLEKSPPFYVSLDRDRVRIDAVAFGNTTLVSEPTLSISTQIHSWINGGMLTEGGSHVTGFLKALSDVNWCPAIVMIHVVMFDPEFAGPTKAKLSVPKIADIVRSALREPLEQYCDRLGSADPRRNT
jgi:DNA gyrase subunit B